MEIGSSYVKVDFKENFISYHISIEEVNLDDSIDKDHFKESLDEAVMNFIKDYKKKTYKSKKFRNGPRKAQVWLGEPDNQDNQDH